MDTIQINLKIDILWTLLSLCVGGALVFSGCAQPAEALTPATGLPTEPSPAPSATLTPTSMPPATPTSVECVQVFQAHELAGSDPPASLVDAPRYTLSDQDFQDYLAIIGIESLCVPQRFGSPFLNVDWNSSQTSSVRGQMISLGFENLYHGGGWSEGFLLYATYDFFAGTEYETFAAREDYDALNRGELADTFMVNGVTGFNRIQQASDCFGQCAAYQTYVFLFETAYLAIVLDLGAYDAAADWKILIQELDAGAYPPEKHAALTDLELMVATIRFNH